MCLHLHMRYISIFYYSTKHLQTQLTQFYLGMCLMCLTMQFTCYQHVKSEKVIYSCHICTVHCIALEASVT